MAARLSNLFGKRFGKLVVKDWIPRGSTPGKWFCICDCGNEKYAITSHLKNGNIKSCGCLLESTKTLNSLSSSKEFSSWYAMHQRCYGSMDEVYVESGRKVCDRWHGNPQGFFNFLEDMGHRPEGTTLERIDNNQGYTPENCKWETLGRQAFNRNKFKNNTTGKTGVYYRRDSCKWFAKISVKGRIISLGCFDTFEGAVKAREQAEIQYYDRNKE